MDPDISALDSFLASSDVDGYLIEADGDAADQRYLSGFTAPDPFVTLYTGETHLLVSSLEYGRAKRTARAATIERHADYDHQANVEDHGRIEGGRRTIAAFLDAYGADSVAVPADFPVGTADGLRRLDISVTADDEDLIGSIRATKTDEEVDHIRGAQRGNEAAMARAEKLLAAATVDDGTLFLDGEVLTAERVKREIEIELLQHDCALDETIVACGSDAADPHDRGSGSLSADKPIIIDIFPRSKKSGYHADMTRTFCVGEPTDTIERWYDLTAEAQVAALDAIEAGVPASTVHGAVCDVYEKAGLPTLRADETTETGFIHTTGHGIGLEVHERPRLGDTDTELEAGHVVTVEPGLYDPAVGGVRVEDMVVVTEDGFENLTDYPKGLRVEKQ